MNPYAISATGAGTARRENDFYETPEDAVEALAQAYLPLIGRRVWEPSCGAGKLARVLEAYGVEVVGTDLVDRGYGTGGVDFLDAPDNGIRSIVTNPPFNIADRFIRRAMALQPTFFALLLKQQFFNAASRLPLWAEFPPKDFRPISWRLDFTGGGAPTMDCAWAVWGSAVPQGRGEPMRRPTVRLSALMQ